jgi:hypothetical protein
MSNDTLTAAAIAFLGTSFVVVQQLPEFVDPACPHTGLVVKLQDFCEEWSQKQTSRPLRLAHFLALA